MPEHILKSWDEFALKLAELKRDLATNTSELWFRGQPNSNWPLLTTLERKTKTVSVYEYYRVILSIKSEVETFTGRQFETPSFGEISHFCSEYDLFSRRLSVADLPAREYVVYLRHHGFPSPLLDWTRSPFVAAYFAFREITDGDAASIYIFAESPDRMKFRSSDKASIYSIGPNITAHRRHFLQQATYTVCVHFDSGIRKHAERGVYFESGNWGFTPHEEVFARPTQGDELRQDVLWKITIPTSERLKILRSLEEYNLNAFSLFGSEESLMETLGIKNFDLGAE